MNLPVDWKAFEYKFSADPRAAFESLAYILFCYELKQDCGIFRYYNQPYIETQPVDTADGHKVGFQAKYYDAGTTVASREQELKAAIEGVKKNFDKEDIEESDKEDKEEVAEAQKDSDNDGKNEKSSEKKGSENPVSDTASSNNNAGSSGSSENTPAPAPPPQKVWVPPVYQTIHHDAVYNTVKVVVCNYCGAEFGSAGEFQVHKDANGG